MFRWSLTFGPNIKAWLLMASCQLGAGDETENHYQEVGQEVRNEHETLDERHSAGCVSSFCSGRNETTEIESISRVKRVMRHVSLFRYCMGLKRSPA